MAVLKVDSVQLEFGNRKILQDVYLHCNQGEVLGLLGRNGTGKSSLLKIIFGTLTPSYKYVSIDDCFIDYGYRNNRIAYLSQQSYLPRGLKISALADMLVDSVHWDAFAALAIYINHQNKRPEQLSGGELRQLEMLMILYSKAEFILLDEPFTHVTPVQTQYFKEIIKQVSKTKGVIVTDHQYYNVLDISDRIVLLTDGCTKHIKDASELLTYKYTNAI
jgi:lipopolysaccharide export system ATP-binding protein